MAKKPEEPKVNVKELDIQKQRKAGALAFILIADMQKGKGDIPGRARICVVIHRRIGRRLGFDRYILLSIAVLDESENDRERAGEQAKFLTDPIVVCRSSYFCCVNSCCLVPVTVNLSTRYSVHREPLGEMREIRACFKQSPTPSGKFSKIPEIWF